MTHSMTAFADSYENASNHATTAGMKLTHPSEYQYQLRHLRHGYIVDAYCRHDGGRRLCASDDHKGPKLKLKDGWDLFDLVKAAIRAWNPPANCNGESRLPLSVETTPESVVRGEFYATKVRLPNGEGPVTILLTETELSVALARAFRIGSQQ